MLKHGQIFVRYARYENLLDVWLNLTSGSSQYLGTSGYRSQMHQLQALTLNLLNHHRQDFLLRLFLFRQEHQSRAIFPLLGHGDTLQQDELMGNLQHDAGTVARLVTRLSTTVLHVLQNL